MQPIQAVAVPFLGVFVQLGGAVLLVGFFMLLRRYVFRRPYFSNWVTAWTWVAIAILSLVIRYLIAPPEGTAGTEGTLAVRLLYFTYQSAKLLAFVYFVRGTTMYVAGGRSAGVMARSYAVVAALVVGAGTAFAVRGGLNEMIIWQSIFAVPVLGYCGSALLWLPHSRRTMGSVATGAGFATLAALWMVYGAAFALIIGAAGSPLARSAASFVALNSYLDLLLDVLLGYGMVVLLMEDAKREVSDAQAELRLSHDHMRRAAMVDSLTDSLNRRAFVEGVGLEMARATFGTIVIADVDNLKLVNDQHGHGVGDLLLRRCADVLRTALRPYDKLYRWGGDEFLLVVPSARASDMLGRLRSALADGEPLISPTDGSILKLELSLGAADYTGAEEIGPAIDEADRAMYADKSRRKGEPRNSPAHIRLSQVVLR